jgi:achilleol B synthase
MYYFLSNRFGTWGICFTYGTLFAVKGLIACGRTYEDSPSISKACNFLLSKQLSTGGWGETYLSSETQVFLFFLFHVSSYKFSLGFGKVMLVLCI